MDYKITGISEPQLDKNGNNHVRLYTPSSWIINDEGKKIYDEGKTIFCYDEEMFDKFELNETITVNQ